MSFGGREGMKKAKNTLHCILWTSSFQNKPSILIFNRFCICCRCETFPHLWYDEVPQRSLCWLEFYLILLSRIYIFSCNFLLLLYLEFLDCEINHILWVTCVNREDYLKNTFCQSEHIILLYVSRCESWSCVYVLWLVTII